MVCNGNEAFIRSYLIQQISEIKRKTQEKIQNISDEIKRRIIKEFPRKHKYSQLRFYRTVIYVNNKRNGNKIERWKAKKFWFVYKPGKWLSYKLQREREKNMKLKLKLKLQEGVMMSLKKEGTLRPWVDYCGLNAVCVKNISNYPAWRTSWPT